jgi:hypothetical protein
MGYALEGVVGGCCREQEQAIIAPPTNAMNVNRLINFIFSPAQHIVQLLLPRIHSQNITSSFTYKAEIYYKFRMLQEKSFVDENRYIIFNEQTFHQVGSYEQLVIYHEPPRFLRQNQQK